LVFRGKDAEHEIMLSDPKAYRFRPVSLADLPRARDGECELGTLAENRVRNGFRQPDGRGNGQFAESALDALYVARNRG
jgi:hypothetical protein